MATVFPIISTFAVKIVALSDTAKEARRALLDTQPKIRHIDDVMSAAGASSNFLQEWCVCTEVKVTRACRVPCDDTHIQDYHRILEWSEGAAIRLAAFIDCKWSISSLLSSRLKEHSRLLVASRGNERSSRN